MHKFYAHGRESDSIFTKRKYLKYTCVNTSVVLGVGTLHTMLRGGWFHTIYVPICTVLYMYCCLGFMAIDYDNQENMLGGFKIV